MVWKQRRELRGKSTTFPFVGSPSEGRYANEFDIISPVLDSDIVISVAKLNSWLVYYTGATKNLFGFPDLKRLHSIRGIQTDIDLMQSW